MQQITIHPATALSDSLGETCAIRAGSLREAGAVFMHEGNLLHARLFETLQSAVTAGGTLYHFRIDGEDADEGIPDFSPDSILCLQPGVPVLSEEDMERGQRFGFASIQPGSKAQERYAFW